MPSSARCRDRLTVSAALLFFVALLLAGMRPDVCAGATAVAPQWLPGLVTGDEVIAVTQHRIETRRGPLEYEARAGRLAIRSQETGEVHGYIFFVAYVVKPGTGAVRPLTFLWNGGPTIPSDYIHLDGVGPRRRTAGGMVDNPDTPLLESDLIFYDPIETGFSRLARPEFAAEFFNFQGDIATTAEFVRAYRARFRTQAQPLFLAGESYGAFRAAALVDVLTERGVTVAGTLLISGDIPNIPQPVAFYDAMHVPARAATAYYHHRLPPELMKDRDAMLREVNKWVTSTYLPALEHIEELSDTERGKIADELALYTGVRPEEIDHKTLVLHLARYLQLISGSDEGQPIQALDTRDTGDFKAGSASVTGAYLRDELGYRTDLTYNYLEKGYVPTPGHPARSSGQQWYYNQPGVTEADTASSLRQDEVTAVARDNPPWIVNALKREKTMHVFVSTGRFDAYNMCEGDVAATATLPADLAARIENHCYEAGHITYLDDAARPKFLSDVSHFIRVTAAAQAHAGARQNTASGASAAR